MTNSSERLCIAGDPAIGSPTSTKQATSFFPARLKGLALVHERQHTFPFGFSQEFFSHWIIPDRTGFAGHQTWRGVWRSEERYPFQNGGQPSPRRARARACPRAAENGRFNLLLCFEECFEDVWTKPRTYVSMFMFCFQRLQLDGRQTRTMMDHGQNQGISGGTGQQDGSTAWNLERSRG